MKHDDKKGFTLVELLGILVLIAIIGILVFVVVDKVLKGGKETAYEKQIKMIELAASNFGSEHPEALPDRGKTTTVSFMVLKMYGYLDLNVSDPNTGLCFPNDAFVDIVNDYNTGKITYSVNIDSIDDGQIACDTYNEKMLEYPNIEIYGETSSLGNGQQATLTITYNYDNIDKSKIHFKEEIISGSGIKTTFEMKEPRYNSDKKLYEIDVLITAGTSDSASVWIEIEEGAITLDDGRKSKASVSQKIQIDNVLELDNIILHNNGVRCEGEACPIYGGAYWGSTEKLCMDRKNNFSTIATFGEFHRTLEIDGYITKWTAVNGGITYNATQIIDLAAVETSNWYYYVYVELEDEEGNINKLYKKDIDTWVKKDVPGYENKYYVEVKDSDELANISSFSEIYPEFKSLNTQYKIHQLDISVLINGTYHVGVCDVNGNCKEKTIEMTHNDCNAPNLVSTNPSDNTTLLNLFIDTPSLKTNYGGIPIDESSNIYIVGALILPSKVTDTDIVAQIMYDVKYDYVYPSFGAENKYTLEYFKLEDSNIINVYELSFGSIQMSDGTVISNSTTLGELKNIINNNKPFCGSNNYMYIIASDQAGNLSIYSENLGVGNCQSGSIDITDIEDASSDCSYDDVVCAMKENSFRWWLCDDQACKNELHQKNLYHCDNYHLNCEYRDDGRYYVSNAEGVYYPLY